MDIKLKEVRNTERIPEMRRTTTIKGFVREGLIIYMEAHQNDKEGYLILLIVCNNSMYRFSISTHK